MVAKQLRPSRNRETFYKFNIIQTPWNQGRIMREGDNAPSVAKGIFLLLVFYTP